MLTEFTRTISIKPTDLAIELATSGDLVAIGAFLNTMAACLTTAANAGSVKPITASEKRNKKISGNLAEGLTSVVRKLQKECIE